MAIRYTSLIYIALFFICLVYALCEFVLVVQYCNAKQIDTCDDWLRDSTRMAMEVGRCTVNALVMAPPILT